MKLPFFILCTVGLFGLAPAFSQEEVNDDDFLFVIAEDVSAIRFWTDLNPNPTKSLEMVAREAVVFTQAYCPGSVCNASRTAMLTCQPPELTGIYQNQDNSQELPTVLHHLVENDYRLRAIGKIFHNGFEQNDVFAEVAHPRPSGKARIELEKRGTDDDVLQIGVRMVGASFGDAALKADLAIDWIGGADASEKNGFFVGFTATHLPFLVPDSPQYSEAYDPDEIELPESNRPDFMDKPNPKYRLSARDKKRVVSRYLGCLRYVSDEAARVIRAFRSRFPQGHVVFLSDHGFLLDEGRSWGKSNTMEAACKVPYFVWSEKLEIRDVSGPVSTGTALPLLLDLCGVPALPKAYYGSPRNRVIAGHMNPSSRVTTYAGSADWWRVAGEGIVVHNKNGVEFITGFDDRPVY